MLTELGYLVRALGDLGQAILLIGGQVPALMWRARNGPGSPLQVVTPTGVAVPRQYSLEPDLLFDVDAAGLLSDRLTEVLRQCGFERSARSHRWSKDLGETCVEIDFFQAPGAEPPTIMTTLPSAELVMSKVSTVSFSTKAGKFEVYIPGPAGYIKSKLEGRGLRRRIQDRCKDSFDVYAFVWLHGTEEVDRSVEAFAEGRALRLELAELFGSTRAEGVREIVSFAGSLRSEDAQLLARAVVDLFEPLMPR